MAGCAAGGSIIAGLVVGAGEGEQWISKPGPLQALEDGIGSRQRAESTIAEPLLAAFKNPQGVSGLRDLELRQRLKRREYAFEFGFGGRRRRVCEKLSRHAFGIVGLTEEWVFQRKGA